MTTTRPATPGDAPAILRLQHAHQRAVLGYPDATVDDVREVLADPDRDPASCVVVDDGGRALGFAMVFADGVSEHTDLDVVVDPDHGAHLLPLLLERALDIALAGARARGRANVQADVGCYRMDTALANALHARGFSPATSFHRMRRDLGGPVDVVLPPGIVVERVEEEIDEVLRRAHRLHMSTFARHFRFVARPFEEWMAGHRARTGTGPLWFATANGADVGFLYETSQFVEDQDAGYVWLLGVERAARGRGIARGLLLSSFAAMRASGRRAALLHVDTANATGATALYESVGMRPVVVIDVWRCLRMT